MYWVCGALGVLRLMKRPVITAVFVILLIGLAGRALIHYYGLNCTSWWRSPWKNYSIGGKWFSLHLIGWAYDVTPVNVGLQALLKVWPFKFVVESDHVHLQIL